MNRQRRQNELVSNPMANNLMMQQYNRLAANGMMPNDMQRAAMMNAKGPM
ncbi:MAG: hypothetical protein INR71_04120 [Terriglobus roseus]|nr:hypothetical protein [Terriglobus roseus]